MQKFILKFYIDMHMRIYKLIMQKLIKKKFDCNLLA
jgi:hypothetical protein